MIDLNELAMQSYEIAQQRFSNIGDLYCLKHCATEVVEAALALDEVATSNDVNLKNLKNKRIEEYVLELADIITCVLTICGKNGFNIETALYDCRDKNRNRIITG